MFKYDKRGVSADKGDVHHAIKNLDKGIHPNAFCKILPDIVAGDASYCNIMHADTAGTKTALAYLVWKETGDISVWEGVVQDALVMNLDDLICVGAVKDIVFSSTIGRNRTKIPSEVLSVVIGASQKLMDRYNKYGLNLVLAGGETADVGDIVRTIDIGFTAFARMKRSDLIVNDFKPNSVIVGISSCGQATYEDCYNGGMGSNGLTSARHDVLSGELMEKYPESFDPAIDKNLIYCGSKKITDIDAHSGRKIGELMASPTRTYAPIISKIIALGKHGIDGIIHCSGGGQTKCLKFAKNVRIVKDNLMAVPPLFKLIQKESGTQDREMFKVFNMGHRMELYVQPERANEIIEISKSFGVQAQQIGYCEGMEGEELIIQYNNQSIVYHDDQR